MGARAASSGTGGGKKDVQVRSPRFGCPPPVHPMTPRPLSVPWVRVRVRIEG